MPKGLMVHTTGSSVAGAGKVHKFLDDGSAVFGSGSAGAGVDNKSITMFDATNGAGSVTVYGNLSASVNISASQYYGDGSELQNVSATSIKADDIAQGDAAVTITTSDGNITLQNAAGDTDAVMNLVNPSSTEATALNINTPAGGLTQYHGGAMSIQAHDDSTIQVGTSAKDLTLQVAGGGAQKLILNSAGTGTDAIDINATAGGIDVDANGAFTVDAGGISLDSDAASNFSVATGGSDAVDLTIASTGGGDSSVLISSAGTGADAIQLNASAGSVDIDSADNVTIDAADDISLTTTSDDGLITLHSAHTAGQAVLIDANAAAGSILDVDAGIMDVDVQGTYNLDASGVTIASDAASSLTTSSGALTLTSAAAATWSTAAGALAVTGTGGLTLDSAGTAAVNLGTAAAAKTITIGNDASTKVDVNALAIELDSAGGIVLNSVTTTTLDATQGISIDAGAASNFTTSGGALTLKGATGETIGTSGQTAAFQGHVTVAGDLTVTGTTTTVDVEVVSTANGVIFEGSSDDAHETTLKAEDPTADHTYHLPDLGNSADEGYVMAFEANPGTSPLISATPAEVNLMDGGTSAGTTAVADGHGIVVNQGGTMAQTTVQTFQTYFDANSVGGSNIVTVGALNAGSISSGFGNIDNGSSTLNTGAATVDSLDASSGGITNAGSIAGATSIDGSGDLTMGTITMTGFTVDADGDTALKSLLVDDNSTIGLDSDTDLMTLKSQLLEIAGNLSASINVSASAFYGDGSNLSGINASNVNPTNEESDTTTFLTFVGAATGDQGLETNTNLTYNALTNTLAAQSASFDFASIKHLSGSSSANMEISSDQDMVFVIDANGSGTQDYSFKAGTSEIASIDELGGFTATAVSASYLSSSANLTVDGTSQFNSAIDVKGTITGDTSLTLDSTTITTAEIGVLDGVTAGTAAASKALVLDGSKNIATIGTVGCGAITSTGVSSFAGGVTPAAADGAALGSATLEWSDLYLADGAVINLGNDQDVTLTHVADAGLTLNSDKKLHFGDTDTYIHQSADGVLDLVSDTEIEINATTIDLNGAVAMDGALTGLTSINVEGTITGDTSLTLDSTTVTTAELGVLSSVTAGTAAASKALVLDSNKDIGTIRNLTIDGTFSDGNYTFDTSGNVTGLGSVSCGAITSTGDTSTFTSTNSADPLIEIKNTTNDANGARLRFVKDKGAAGADNDVAGIIEFYADDDNQDQVLFAQIKATVADASNGAEGGKLELGVASHDGEMNAGITLTDGSAEDEIDVTIGKGANSVVTIVGDLTVSGTTTTLDTTNLLVEDPLIVLNKANSSANGNGGIAIEMGGSSADMVFGRVANDTWGVGTKDTSGGTATDVSDMTLTTFRASKLEIDGTGDYIDVDTHLKLVSTADISLVPGGNDVLIDKDDCSLKFGDGQDVQLAHDNTNQLLTLSAAQDDYGFKLMTVDGSDTEGQNFLNKVVTGTTSGNAHVSSATFNGTMFYLSAVHGGAASEGDSDFSAWATFNQANKFYFVENGKVFASAFLSE